MPLKRNQIRAQVDNAQNVLDLIAILQQIPINTIQTLIKNELKKCDDNKINKIFHETHPMTEILPDAIIQKILSFDEYCVENIFVNKSFKAAAENNDKMKLKERKQIIKSEANVDIKNNYFADGADAEYWIIDQNRTQLNDKEIAFGYKGPMNNIMDAINNCKSGDTLLFYDGKYEIKHEFNAGIIDKLNKISFIGMGENVIFQQFDVSIFVTNDVYFKNIRFHWQDIEEGGAICVLKNGNLWMEHCKMSGDRLCDGIVFVRNTSIYLAHCEFDNLEVAVYIPALGTSAIVLGCKFTNCGRRHRDASEKNPTICLETIEGIDDESKMFNTKIRIIGNEVVDDGIGEWIAFSFSTGRNFYDRFLESGSYEIKNNSIKGKNSIFTNVNNELERRNPNKIYLVDLRHDQEMDLMAKINMSYAEYTELEI